MSRRSSRHSPVGALSPKRVLVSQRARLRVPSEYLHNARRHLCRQPRAGIASRRGESCFPSSEIPSTKSRLLKQTVHASREFWQASQVVVVLKRVLVFFRRHKQDLVADPRDASAAIRRSRRESVSKHIGTHAVCGHAHPALTRPSPAARAASAALPGYIVGASDRLRSIWQDRADSADKAGAHPLGTEGHRLPEGRAGAMEGDASECRRARVRGLRALCG